MTAFEVSAGRPQVIIQDDFYRDPVVVREIALLQTYKAHPNDHKGMRTETHFRPDEIKARFEQLLGFTISGWEAYGYNGVFQYHTPTDLLVYHADKQQYAAVVYLTPDAPPECGSILLRSKATKLRKVNVRNAQAIGLSLQQAVDQTFKDSILDRTKWDVVDVIGNVFNRCAIWDAQLLHAANGYFGHDLVTGRLAHMFFFDREQGSV